MSNIINFPGRPDQPTEHTVCDVLDMCVEHAYVDGLIDEDGLRHLLHCVNTVRMLHEHMMESESE